MSAAVGRRRSPGRPAAVGRVAWALGGLAALVGGTLLGWDASLLAAIVEPPALVRAGLVGGSVTVGLWLLGGAVARLREGAAAAPDSPEPGDRDLPTLIRGVRLVFLAVAALAAGAGWLTAHPLPFVVALVIAGVDILETSFLLFVVTARRRA